MNPVSRDLYVDQLLTNILLGYSNPIYIADLIAPLVTVTKQSGLIPAMLQSDWFRDSAQKRGPGTPSLGHGFGTDLTATYYCHRYSFRHEIDDDTRGNAGPPFQLDSMSTKFVGDKILMKREVNWATQNFKTGVWASDKTGGTDFTAWDDIGGGNPAKDIEDYRNDIEERIGAEANTLVIGKRVWSSGLKFNPVLVDMVKYTQRGQLGPELVASLLEVDKLHIGKAIYTTTIAGTAEASVTYSRIWGKKALLMHVAPSPGIMAPSASYTFAWTREGAPAGPWYIKRMRNEEAEIDIIEANSYFDQKVTQSRAGTFMTSVVS